MANNQSRMTLYSHVNNAVKSDRNSLGKANPSAAIELEVSGPSAARNPLVDASNPLLHGAGALLQVNEVLGNDSDGAAVQASNLDVSNGAAVDENNLLATSAHDAVQQGGMDGFDYDNGQLEFPVGGDGNLLNPFGVPHTAQAGGAGKENEDFVAPLQDEAEESDGSDMVDYTTFTPAETLDRLSEYKQAYRIARRH